MAIILHKNIKETELHAPKGFTLGTTNSMSYSLRTEGDVADFQDIEYLPSAINFVDGNNPPPTAVLGDIYVIFDGGGGVVDAGWGSIPFDSWTRFDSAAWNDVPGVDGFMCYDKTAKVFKTFNGTAWVLAGGGVTNLSEGTSTTTTVDVDSDTGTNATLLAASTLRAGLMTKAKFDEVVVNNSKVSFPEAPNDGQDYVRKSLGWSVFAVSDTNLGTDNLTNTAPTRTYNLNSFELSFIDGANTKLKVTPIGVVIGTSVLAAGTDFKVKGSGSTSGTKNFRSENLAGTSFFEHLGDGSLLSEATGSNVFKITSNLANGASGLAFHNGAAIKGVLYSYGAGAAGLFTNANYYANYDGGGQFWRNAGGGSYKWIANVGTTDGDVGMKFNDTGLMVGAGIGALAYSGDVHFQGRSTSGIGLYLSDSNGVARHVFNNAGSFDFSSSKNAVLSNKIGNTLTSQYCTTTFVNNLGTIGEILIAGSTALTAEYQDAFLLRTGSSSSKMIFANKNIAGNSGMYFMTDNVPSDANTDMKLTINGLLVGDGIGGTAVGARLHVVGTIRSDQTTVLGKTISTDFLPININGTVRYLAIYD